MAKMTGKKISSLELAVKAEELGVNPFEILLMFAAGDSEALGYDPDPVTGMPPIINAKYRLSAAQEACKYMYPQLKAVEVTGNPEKPLEHKHTLLRALLNEAEEAARGGRNDPPPYKPPVEPVPEEKA